MKRIIFYMLLSISLLHNTQCNDVTKSAPPALTQEENAALYHLNILMTYKPSFIEDDNFKIDHCLNILEKKIRTLEYRINTKESIWKSSLIFLGIMESINAAAMSMPIYPKVRDFFNHNFENIDISKSMLNKLPDLTFSRSEKKYLNLFKVQNITIVHEWWEIFNYNTINNMSPKDQEKLRLLALKEAISDAKFHIYLATGSFLLLSLLIIYPIYHDASNYQNNLANNLRQNQQRYQELLDEKERRKLKDYIPQQRIWFSPNEFSKLLYNESIK